MLTPQYVENRCDFKRRSKLSQCPVRKLSGNKFQTDGPATEKARLGGLGGATGGLGGTTGRASDSRSEGRGFDSH